MTTCHSMESTTARKIAWAAVILLAAAVAACGGSTQAITGTAPSVVSPGAGTTDGVGSFNLLKEGRGKHGHSPTPDIGTTPEPDDPEGDADDFGNGFGHGKAAIQYEGFSTLITGKCTEGLIIAFNDDIPVTTIKTDLATEFQRTSCKALELAGDTPVHLHIAARKIADGSLVAIYVRMQGPKDDNGDDPEEEEGTTPQ